MEPKGITDGKHAIIPYLHILSLHDLNLLHIQSVLADNV